MNILAQVCCAPCEIYPIAKLRKDGHRASGFFYNPNIHPYSEYLKRKSEVERYSKDIGLSVAIGNYDIEEFFRRIVSRETPNNRCPLCWRLRIGKTAEAAKEGGFDAFTSTLLGSPYQDHTVIKEICEEIAKGSGISFYYEDFRLGFKDAHDIAKKNGIYCQNYCGCLFSEKERIDKRAQKPTGKVLR